MTRKSILLIFGILSLLPSGAAISQTSPPICPQGSWPSRNSNGWVCAHSETTTTDTSSNDKPQKRGGHGGGGGGMGGSGGGMDGIPR